MSKKIWLFLAAFMAIFLAAPLTASAVDVEINERNFPEDGFRKYVSEQFDANRDGILSQAEADSVTKMDFHGYSVLNIKGIDNFPNLKELNCSGCKMGMLQFPSALNKRLEVLDCSYNNLVELNVSRFTALKKLNCSYNKIETLTLNGNSYDAWGAVSLTDLDCSNNKITALDLSYSKELAYLDCSANEIEVLRAEENNRELAYLNCSDNKPLRLLRVSNGKLTDLDLSNLAGLVQVSCRNNQLKTINLSGCINLSSIWCGENQLDRLDMSDCKKMRYLYCADNQLTDLDLSNFELYGLECGWNKLTELNLETCTELETLSCVVNQLTDLDVSMCSKLRFLWCGHNKIADLDIRNCEQIKLFHCEGSLVKNLDVTEFPFLDSLWCYDSELTSLDCDKEIGDLIIGNQKPSLTIQKSSGKWIADLSKVIDAKNLGKVMLAENQQWQYDAVTGKASYLGEDIPSKLVYYYQGNKLPENAMNVTLYLLRETKPCNVVMKFGAAQAYADGKIAPTTQYANGYATLKNIGGTAMIPLRYIAEVNGFDVAYDEATMKTKVTNKATGGYLLITPGSNVVEKRGASDEFISKTEAPQPFTVENGVTMGPQRFVCEALGLTVHYKWVSNDEQYVTVTTDVITPEEADALISKAKKLGL